MYVSDTGAFFSFGNYYPDHFPDFWKRINYLVENGKFVSTREVRREINRNFPFDHVAEWVKNHGDIFLIPSLEEQRFVRELFKKEKNRELIPKQHILKGFPVADPFVIAAAYLHKAKVITREAFKPGAAKVPNVCHSFGIECIGIEDFLKIENLVFRAKS
jgi:hypothetical protein